MTIDIDRFHVVGTERVNALTEFVCEVYGYDHGQLADALGVYRPHFGRMRKGGIGQWSYGALVQLIDLATQADKSMVFRWVFGELPTSEEK